MPRMLPEEFQRSHDLALELYGRLQHFVVAGEEQDVFFCECPLRDPSHAEAIESLDGEELWQWFEDNGYQDVNEEFTVRHTVVAVLADLLSFIYEGLQASEKGKLAVAYSLFRKPIRDNLFILEWILADRPGYLASFRVGPKEIDVSAMTKERRVEIIGKAQDATSLGRWIPPEFLHELRFDKAASHGFDGVCNQAIHIVTTVKHYVTETGNLNFVFSGDEERQAQWAHLYYALPIVLYHAVHVVESLVETFAPDFQDEDALTSIRRNLRYLLWMDDMGEAEDGQCAAMLMKELLDGQSIGCTACGVPFDFDTEGIRAFVERGELSCPGCHLVVSIEEPEPPTDVDPDQRVEG
jgi:hypothetical protein